MIKSGIISYFLKKNRSAWIPTRPENAETNAEYTELQKLVIYYADECGCSTIVVPTGFEGGGMGPEKNATLRTFLEWCKVARPKLGIELGVLKPTKASFGYDLSDGIVLDYAVPEAIRFTSDYSTIHTTRSFYTYEVVESQPFGPESMVYLLRLRITGGRYRLLFFRKDAPESKLTDVETPELWEQLKTGEDEYTVPILIGNAPQYGLLLEVKDGSPYHEILSCTKATGDQLAPFTIRGKYMGHLRGLGGLKLDVPYTVPGLQMDFDNHYTIDRLESHAVKVKGFIDSCDANITGLHIYGDEPKCFESHEEYVRSMSTCFSILRAYTDLPITCFGDALCGHNSDFAKGVYANGPSWKTTEWYRTKGFGLDVWGYPLYLERGLSDAIDFGAKSINLGISPHWGNMRNVCLAQGIAAKAITVTQLAKISLGLLKIGVRDYAENMQEAWRAHERFNLFEEGLRL